MGINTSNTSYFLSENLNTSSVNNSDNESSKSCFPNIKKIRNHCSAHLPETLCIAAGLGIGLVGVGLALGATAPALALFGVGLAVGGGAVALGSFVVSSIKAYRNAKRENVEDIELTNCNNITPNLENQNPPAAQGPAAQDPTAQDPAAQDPAAQGPAAQDPAAQDPAAQGPHPAAHILTGWAKKMQLRASANGPSASRGATVLAKVATNWAKITELLSSDTIPLATVQMVILELTGALLHLTRANEPSDPRVSLNNLRIILDMCASHGNDWSDVEIETKLGASDPCLEALMRTFFGFDTKGKASVNPKKDINTTLTRYLEEYFAQHNEKGSNDPTLFKNWLKEQDGVVGGLASDGEITMQVIEKYIGGYAMDILGIFCEDEDDD